VSIEGHQSRRADDRNDCLIAQVLSQVEPLESLPAIHATLMNTGAGTAGEDAGRKKL
jgi:hypothetical protein